MAESSNESRPRPVRRATNPMQYRLGPGELHAKALAMLRAREKMKALRITHVITDRFATTEGRIFKFFAARTDSPNHVSFEIILDEIGNIINPKNLQKREGVEPFTRQDWAVDTTRLFRFDNPQFRIDPPQNAWTLKKGGYLQRNSYRHDSEKNA